MSKWVYWTPRVLSILFILFLTLFSLDILGNGYGFWETILGLFMHNIPSIVLTILLIFTWKRELIGVVTFGIAGLLYIVLLFFSPFKWFKIAWAIQIAGPAFLVSYLFWLNWKRKK